MEASGSLPWGLVLEAPFLSVPAVAVNTIKWLPRTAKRLKDRVAILHGTRDDVVPFDQGMWLAKASKLRLHSFDRGHDDIVLDPRLAGRLSDIFDKWDRR